MSQNKTKQTISILLGCEQLFPDNQVLLRTRVLLEKMKDSNCTRNEFLRDVFSLFRAMGEDSLTNKIENFLISEKPSECLSSFIALINQFSYQKLPPSFYMLFDCFDIESELSLIVQKDLVKEFSKNFLKNHIGESELSQRISLLSDLVLQMAFKSQDTQKFQRVLLKALDEMSEKHIFFSKLKDLFLDKEKFSTIQKVCDLYILVYDQERMKDLRSALVHFHEFGSDKKVFYFLNYFFSEDLFLILTNLRKSKPELSLTSVFSQGQLKSKIWAVNTLEKLKLPSFESVAVLCGWYGVLSYLLRQNVSLGRSITRMRSIDKDFESQGVAEIINKKDLLDDWKFKAITADILDLEFNAESKKLILPMENAKGREWHEDTAYDLLINTSCEHMERFSDWYKMVPSGQLLLLQSNNYFSHKEHVNCIPSLRKFAKSAPMKKLLYKGTLTLPKYDRFMLIGYK